MICLTRRTNTRSSRKAVIVGGILSDHDLCGGKNEYGYPSCCRCQQVCSQPPGHEHDVNHCSQTVAVDLDDLNVRDVRSGTNSAFHLAGNTGPCSHGLPHFLHHPKPEQTTATRDYQGFCRSKDWGCRTWLD